MILRQHLTLSFFFSQQPGLEIMKLTELSWKGTQVKKCFINAGKPSIISQIQALNPLRHLQMQSCQLTTKQWKVLGKNSSLKFWIIIQTIQESCFQQLIKLLISLHLSLLSTTVKLPPLGTVVTVLNQQVSKSSLATFTCRAKIWSWSDFCSCQIIDVVVNCIIWYRCNLISFRSFTFVRVLVRKIQQKGKVM